MNPFFALRAARPGAGTAAACPTPCTSSLLPVQQLLQVKQFIAENQTDKPGAIPAAAPAPKPKRCAAVGFRLGISVTLFAMNS